MVAATGPGPRRAAGPSGMGLPPPPPSKPADLGSLGKGTSIPGPRPGGAVPGPRAAPAPTSRESDLLESLAGRVACQGLLA